MSNLLEKDEISLKQVFDILREYVDEVKKHWKLILIGALLFAAYSGYKAFVKPVTYSERLTFMMDDAGGAEIPGFDILGDLFGGRRGGQDNLDKILQLFGSKKIIHSTLFDSVTIDNKKDFLANHYLNKYSVDYLVGAYQSMGGLSYVEEWPKKLLNDENFKFTSDSTASFSNIENQYLRLLYEKITGNDDVGITRSLNSDLDNDSGIMTLTMRSEHPEITLAVLNNIYDKLSAFFVEKSTEKQTKTYRIIKHKKDSIITALKTSEYRLADFKDSNRKLVTVKGYLDQLRLEREVAILNVMYGEVVKQMEATDFALKNKTPVVQIIDLPRSPIVPSKKSWKNSFVVGLILGAFLAMVFVIGRAIFRKIIGSV